MTRKQMIEFLEGAHELLITIDNQLPESELGKYGKMIASTAKGSVEQLKFCIQNLEDPDYQNATRNNSKNLN